MLTCHRYKLVQSTYVMLCQVAFNCFGLRISVPSLTLCWHLTIKDLNLNLYAIPWHQEDVYSSRKGAFTKEIPESWHIVGVQTSMDKVFTNDKLCRTQLAVTEVSKAQAQMLTFI